MVVAGAEEVEFFSCSFFYPLGFFFPSLTPVDPYFTSLLFSHSSLPLRFRAPMDPSGSGAAAASSAPSKRSTVAAAVNGGAAEPGSVGPASTSGASSEPRKKKPKQPKPSLFQRFAQQELSGWSPIITPRGLVAYFLIAGVLCAAAGGALLAATLSVVEASARYDNAGPFGAVDAAATGASATNAARQALLAAAGGDGVNVTVDIPITKAMRPPVSLELFTRRS